MGTFTEFDPRSRPPQIPRLLGRFYFKTQGKPLFWRLSKCAKSGRYLSKTRHFIPLHNTPNLSSPGGFAASSGEISQRSATRCNVPFSMSRSDTCLTRWSFFPPRSTRVATLQHEWLRHLGSSQLRWAPPGHSVGRFAPSDVEQGPSAWPSATLHLASPGSLPAVLHVLPWQVRAPGSASRPPCSSLVGSVGNLNGLRPNYLPIHSFVDVLRVVHQASRRIRGLILRPLMLLKA